MRVPPGTNTRPTSDRVREALFSSVESAMGSLDGRRVLDLFAGSGALGLEAVSRGAGSAVMIEKDARAAATIRANVAELGIAGVRVVHNSVERVLAGSVPGDPFDLVLADPPYDLASSRLVDLLKLLAAGWLGADALVVVERDRRSESLTWPTGIESLRERRYGETMLWYGRHSP